MSPYFYLSQWGVSDTWQYLMASLCVMQHSPQPCLIWFSFPGFGKILVVGGRLGHRSNVLNTVSLIDPEKKTTCQLPHPLPQGLVYSAGGLVSTVDGRRPLICGGWDGSYSNKCYLLGSSGWATVHQLSAPSAGLFFVHLSRRCTPSTFLKNWLFQFFGTDFPIFRSGFCFITEFSLFWNIDFNSWN